MFCLYIVDAVLFILFKFGFGYYADKKKLDSLLASKSTIIRRKGVTKPTAQ